MALNALARCCVVGAAFGIAGAASPAWADTIGIHTLGDSLTYGFTGGNDGGRTNDSGWRKYLYVDLLNAGLTVDMLGTQNDSDGDIPGHPEGGVSTVTTNGGVVAFDGDHDGHSGWRIDATAESGVPNGSGLDDRLGSSDQGLFEYVQSGTFDTQIAAADYQLLAIGINDVRRGIVNAYSDGTLRGNQSGHESTADRLDNLIAEILNGRGFAGTLFVSNITPVATGADPFNSYAGRQGSFSGDLVNDAIDLANADIAALFDANGNHLTFGEQVRLLDAHGAIDRNLDLIDDGLHLNDLGNQALGTLYSDAILAAVPEPGSVLLLMAGGLALIGRPRRA